MDFLPNVPLGLAERKLTITLVTFSVACVASVSNRVIARKLERKQKKKVEGGGGGEKRFLLSPPPPPPSLFFLLLPQLSRRTSRGNACYAGYIFCPGAVFRQSRFVVLSLEFSPLCACTPRGDMGRRVFCKTNLP